MIYEGKFCHAGLSCIYWWIDDDDNCDDDDDLDGTLLIMIFAHHMR